MRRLKLIERKQNLVDRVIMNTFRSGSRQEWRYDTKIEKLSALQVVF